MRILISAVVVSLAVSVIASAQSAPDARIEALLTRLFPNSTRISAKEGAPPRRHRRHLTCVDYKPQRDASDQEQRSADGDPLSQAATLTFFQSIS
jgi:hypothetical protein